MRVSGVRMAASITENLALITSRVTDTYQVHGDLFLCAIFAIFALITSRSTETYQMQCNFGPILGIELNC